MIATASRVSVKAGELLVLENSRIRALGVPSLGGCIDVGGVVEPVVSVTVSDFRGAD
jgi:hypothetical protein